MNSFWKKANYIMMESQITFLFPNLERAAENRIPLKKVSTLYSISIKYKTTVAKLVKLNRLKNKNALQVGQKIRVR